MGTDGLTALPAYSMNPRSFGNALRVSGIRAIPGIRSAKWSEPPGIQCFIVAPSHAASSMN